MRRRVLLGHPTFGIKSLWNWVTVLILAVILPIFLVRLFPTKANAWNVFDDKEEVHELSQGHKKHLKEVNAIKTAICSIVLGLVVGLFTWTLMHMDRLDVPSNDPINSPFSPKSLRIATGHTFYLNLFTAVVTGAIITIFYFLNNNYC